MRTRNEIITTSTSSLGVDCIQNRFEVMRWPDCGIFRRRSLEAVIGKDTSVSTILHCLEHLFYGQFFRYSFQNSCRYKEKWHDLKTCLPAEMVFLAFLYRSSWPFEYVLLVEEGEFSVEDIIIGLKKTFLQLNRKQQRARFTAFGLPKQVGKRACAQKPLKDHHCPTEKAPFYKICFTGNCFLSGYLIVYCTYCYLRALIEAKQIWATPSNQNL